MFDLPEIDWSRLDFQWLIDDINMIITMMKIITIGVPVLGILIFFGIIFMFIRSIFTLRRIEKHMREMKEYMKRM